MVTDEHKAKKVKIRKLATNKEDTMKTLFSDEKLFDIDGTQNDRICAEADIKDGIRQLRKFPLKGYGLAWSVF